MSSSVKFPAASATERILSLTNQLKPQSSNSQNSHSSISNSPEKMSVPKFQGWLGLDKTSVEGKLVWQEYEPKTWTESDVDIKITHCGVCASDLHTLRSGWGPTDYPVCVGHEIAGIAVKVGKDVKHIKVGDRVGVGAQSSSCHDCEECTAGLEQYCSKGNVGTYNGKYPDGSKSYGGYADYCRAPSSHTVKIPDGLSLAEAAPMLCGGITVFSPLVNGKTGPGKRVGIVGFGGLGHFGVLFAKALKADEVVVISRTNAKKEDAFKMGATKFIATDEDEGWAKKNASSLDLIVSTVSSPKMPLSKYLQLLRRFGEYIQVGAPEDLMPQFAAFSLITKGAKLGGSSIGSPSQITQMLEFAVKNNVKPWIQARPLKDANQVIVDMEGGKARYRYVLVNEKHVAEEKQ